MRPTFGFGRPTTLPGRGLPLPLPTTLLNHDVAPDGRFVTIVPEGDFGGSSVGNFVVVQSWFEELRRLVPTN